MHLPVVLNLFILLSFLPALYLALVLLGVFVVILACCKRQSRADSYEPIIPTPLFLSFRFGEGKGGKPFAAIVIDTSIIQRVHI